MVRSSIEDSKTEKSLDLFYFFLDPKNEARNSIWHPAARGGGYSLDSFAFLQLGPALGTGSPLKIMTLLPDMTLLPGYDSHTFRGLGPLGPPKTRLIIRTRLIIAVSGQKGEVR
jgi:hypothetical protein